jgi:hypothetical protein
MKWLINLESVSQRVAITRQWRGFIVSRLEHLPAMGECGEADGWRLEVVDLASQLRGS